MLIVLSGVQITGIYFSECNFYPVDRHAHYFIELTAVAALYVRIYVGYLSSYSITHSFRYFCHVAS